MLEYIKSWLLAQKSEKGQDLAEYALLLGLIALVVMVAVILLGTSLSGLFSDMGSTIATWFS